MIPGPVIKGRKVTLRPVERTDLPVLQAMLQKPGIAHWWPGYEQAGRLAEELFGESPQVVPFVIEAEGAVAGLIWYYEESDPQYRHAGIDITVDCDWQGKGLGADALRALAAFLFEQIGHHRIIIDPSTTNERAIHVYSKVGFKPVGVLRRYERLADGAFRDGLLMDLLPEDLRHNA